MLPALSFTATVKQTFVPSEIEFVPSSFAVFMFVNFQLVVPDGVAETVVQPAGGTAVFAAGAEGAVSPV